MQKTIAGVLSLVALAPAAALLAAAPAGDGADARSVLSFLNQVIEWRRQAIDSSRLADDPGDFIYTTDNAAAANQIAVLAFQYASAQAALVAPQQPTASGPGNSTDNTAALEQQTQDKITGIQSELANVERLPARTSAQRAGRDAKRQELQSELALAQARLDTLKSFTGFIRQANSKNKNTNAAGSLTEQIDQLSRSIGLGTGQRKARDSSTTAANSTAAAQGQAAAAQSSAKAKQQPSGIVGLIEESLALTRKSQNINAVITSTQNLQGSLNRLRAPLMTELVDTVKQASQVEQAADTADAATLAAQTKQLDQSTARFKLLSAAALPIGEDCLLLDTYLRRLQQWKASVDQSDATLLRRLGLQIGIVGGAIILLLIFSEIWKKATFRYIKDPRRRSQFLLLRRIILGVIITFVVAFALVTEAGSLATYAGLLTAGLAVALQNVILSVVAYFFLIGRYGLHVGDRVTISGITGDVFEIGLVRLHLIEVSGAGNDMHPTGRSVIFSNSVILQPTISLYKQLPGSDFVWHEVRLTLSPSSDFQNIEKRLLKAVDAIFETYKSGLRFRTPSEGLGLGWTDPKPASRLRFAEGGLEIVIRYPVEVARAGEIDDKITRVILHAISEEADVRLVPTTAPNLQPNPHVGNAPVQPAP
ncbi:MAG: mechanosensitive ion channel family protein [Acidobacteriaceae bacterium]